MFKVLKWKYYDKSAGLQEYTVTQVDDDTVYDTDEFTAEVASFPTFEEAEKEMHRLNELSAGKVSSEQSDS